MKGIIEGEANNQNQNDTLKYTNFPTLLKNWHFNCHIFGHTNENQSANGAKDNAKNG